MVIIGLVSIAKKTATKVEISLKFSLFIMYIQNVGMVIIAITELIPQKF